MEIVQFEEQHVGKAARVLVNQFTRWLKTFPLLPKRND